MLCIWLVLLLFVCELWDHSGKLLAQTWKIQIQHHYVHLDRCLSLLSISDLYFAIVCWWAKIGAAFPLIKNWTFMLKLFFNVVKYFTGTFNIYVFSFIRFCKVKCLQIALLFVISNNFCSAIPTNSKFLIVSSLFM